MVRIGWFPKHYPHTFFHLLAWLRTKDRLLRWLIPISSTGYDFYWLESETRDRLFCSCPVTGAIWSRILLQIGVQRSQVNWPSETRWILTMKGQSLDLIILWLHWTLYMYVLYGTRGMDGSSRDIRIGKVSSYKCSWSCHDTPFGWPKFLHKIVTSKVVNMYLLLFLTFCWQTGNFFVIRLIP